MKLWNDENEKFALMREKLYTPVVGDILDELGYYHQFLPQDIRPLREDMKLAGKAMTVLMTDVYGPQKKPFGLLTEALDQLKEHGLARAALAAATAPAAPAEAPPPEYGAEDITAALSDPASTFPALADEVERRLGKKLTANDLKILYTLYDHLALPTEVIFLLVNWCVEEMERKYGPGRKPFLSQIRREGFVWARKGIDTVEAAERYLQTLVRLRGRGAEVLRLLDIPPRPLVEREKNYIAAWDQMGFDNEALRAAYERTVMKKQSMDWSYMNGILRR